MKIHKYNTVTGKGFATMSIKHYVTSDRLELAAAYAIDRGQEAEKITRRILKDRLEYLLSDKGEDMEYLWDKLSQTSIVLGKTVASNLYPEFYKDYRQEGQK